MVKEEDVKKFIEDCKKRGMGPTKTWGAVKSQFGDMYQTDRKRLGRWFRDSFEEKEWKKEEEKPSFWSRLRSGAKKSKEKIKSAKEKVEKRAVKEEGELSTTGKVGKFFFFFFLLLGSFYALARPYLEEFFTIVSGQFIYYVGSPALAYFLAGLALVGLAAFITLTFFYRSRFEYGVIACVILIFILLFWQPIATGILNILIPGGVLREELEKSFCLLIPGRDPLYCQKLIAEEPTGEKIGGPTAYRLGIDWKSGVAQGCLPYQMGLKITNPQPKYPATDVIVKGYLRAEEIGTVSYLTPDNCCEDCGQYCVVGEGGDNPLDLILDSNGTLPSEYKELDLSIRVKYSYSGWGSGKFIVFGSEDDEFSPGEIEEDTKPDWGPGPMDINVFFIPKSYTIGDLRDRALMMINIHNKGEGYATKEDKSIKITPDEVLAKYVDINCTGWGETIPINIDHPLPEYPIRKKTSFLCNITNLTNIPSIENYRVFDFNVTLNYKYSRLETYPEPLYVNLDYC